MPPLITRSGTVVFLVLILIIVIVIALMALVTVTVAVKKASGRQTLMARCGGWFSAQLIYTGSWPATPHRTLVSGLVLFLSLGHPQRRSHHWFPRLITNFNSLYSPPVRPNTTSRIPSQALRSPAATKPPLVSSAHYKLQ